MVPNPVPSRPARPGTPLATAGGSAGRRAVWAFLGFLSDVRVQAEALGMARSPFDSVFFCSPGGSFCASCWPSRPQPWLAVPNFGALVLGHGCVAVSYGY